MKIKTKKLLATLITSTLLSSASASEKISSIWGFAAGSTQANYFRAILTEANQLQKDYEFLFEHRPGAGGAIASKHVLDNLAQTKILAHTAAIFVRPNLYPQTTPSAENFKPLLIMGYSPAVLITRGKTLEQLTKQQKIVLGTAGAGSSTHLMAANFAKNFTGKDIVIVHYKDTLEAFTSVMGEHIDATFEFLGDAKGKATANTTFVGLTGVTKHDNIPLLKDLGFDNMKLVDGVFGIYVHKDLDPKIFNKLQTTLVNAERSDKVKKLYVQDYVTKPQEILDYSQLNQWHVKSIKMFNTLTQGIKLD